MDKKVLRWNFIFQYGWVLTNVFNSLLLLPFYIKYIDINTLGVWLASSSILGWMTMVDPGIGEVLQQKIAELRGKNETGDIGKSIGSGLLSSAIILLLAAVVGLVFFFCLGFIINKDVSQYQNLPAALFITVFATGLSLVSFTLTGINQGLHNSAQVAISSLTSNFLFLIVNLVFLFAGFGVMSIAIANLSRAIFMNVYNFVAMKRLLNREIIAISFDVVYFKKFIRIFSFTSASKIMTGISNSLDMVVLARFISPGMITIYEINKRPLNLTNSLIGRHSVALMPLISHTKGKGDNAAIVQLINKQFRIYVYAAIFTAFMFLINYYDLITLWVGEGKYIGNQILFILVVASFVNLLSYFMSNVGYALGDIKKNSSFNIIRSLIYAVMVFLAAKYYGIIGTAVVLLVTVLFIDVSYFSYRVYKLGFLPLSLIKYIGGQCLIIVPAAAGATWIIHLFIKANIQANMYLAKLITSSALFTTFYLVLLIFIDKGLRDLLKQYKNRLAVSLT